MTAPRQFPGLELERVDTEETFECARCHRKTDAEDGVDGDHVDIYGAWCSDCWVEVEREIHERKWWEL